MAPSDDRDDRSILRLNGRPLGRCEDQKRSEINHLNHLNDPNEPNEQNQFNDVNEQDDLNGQNKLEKGNNYDSNIQLCNNFGGVQCFMGAGGKFRRPVCRLHIWSLGH